MLCGCSLHTLPHDSIDFHISLLSYTYNVDKLHDDKVATIRPTIQFIFQNATPDTAAPTPAMIADISSEKHIFNYVVTQYIF